MTVLHPEWTAGTLPVPDWCPVPILQDQREFERFYLWVMSQRVRSVLEVGSFYGGTLWFWSRLIAVERIVAIDLPVVDADSRAEQARACRAMWPGWMAGIDFVHVVGNSTDAGIVERAAKLGQYDMAFIDGDHASNIVRADWANYSPLVRRGGFVAFHDTAGIAGIREFVDELRVDHETVDFRCPSSDLGITAVFV